VLFDCRFQAPEKEPGYIQSISDACFRMWCVLDPGERCKDKEELIRAQRVPFSFPGRLFSLRMPKPTLPDMPKRRKVLFRHRAPAALPSDSSSCRLTSH